jgi:hypothetical protein
MPEAWPVGLAAGDGPFRICDNGRDTPVSDGP